jgi:hypothetical protein
MKDMADVLTSCCASIEVFRLFNIKVSTGNGVLDAITIIVLVITIFAGVILYRRYGTAPTKRRKPSKPN